MYKLWLLMFYPFEKKARDAVVSGWCQGGEFYQVLNSIFCRDVSAALSKFV